MQHLTSVETFAWTCGHDGPGACAQCFDRVLGERNRLIIRVGELLPVLVALRRQVEQDGPVDSEVSALLATFTGGLNR